MGFPLRNYKENPPPEAKIKNLIGTKETQRESTARGETFSRIGDLLREPTEKSPPEVKIES